MIIHTGKNIIIKLQKACEEHKNHKLNLIEFCTVCQMHSMCIASTVDISLHLLEV